MKIPGILGVLYYHNKTKFCHNHFVVKTQSTTIRVFWYCGTTWWFSFFCLWHYDNLSHFQVVPQHNYRKNTKKHVLPQAYCGRTYFFVFFFVLVLRINKKSNKKSKIFKKLNFWPLLIMKFKFLCFIVVVHLSPNCYDQKSFILKIV